MTCTQATPPRCTSRGLRAHQRVNAQAQRFACEQHTAIDTESAKMQTHSAKTAYFWLLSPNGSAVWRSHHLTSRPDHHQTGGIALHEAPTRRRHAEEGLHVVQNHHRWRCGKRRRARLRHPWAARTGRAAHWHTQQPGPTAGPGAQKIRGPASYNQRHTATRSVL